jgi:mono/diheme cytochrome c family protein
MIARSSTITLALIAATLGACSSAPSSSAAFASYQIVSADGLPLKVNVGDAFRLTVVETLSDGTTLPLASDATVVWSGPPRVTALPKGSTPTDSIWPQPGVGPTAMWVSNPDHLTPAQVNGVLYVLDIGSGSNPSINVTATVSGGTAPAGLASATLAVGAFPAGDVTRGKAIYGSNCAPCHGAQGEGASAPGLNADPGNLAGDPSWTSPMLGITARSNMDNMGVSLDLSMPRWLVLPSANGHLLTTQDFSDAYAFLQTQHTAAAAAP